ncbi:MAG: glycosyltransferase [Microthrixaceae bacterium]
MRIHQLLVGANSGDAVTEAAFRLQGAYSRIAESEVFAVHIHPALAGRVRRLVDFPLDGSPHDVVIVHVSIGEPGLLDFVANCPERIVLNYHNITPARFFDGFDPAFAAWLRGGRWDLRSLVTVADGAIADSRFNAAELESLGMADVEVAPPPLNLARLHEVEPDEDLVAELDASPGPLILVVGQILAHKRPELAVDALHLLNVNHAPEARMVLAGVLTSPAWSSALVRHVESLKLSTARVMGAVSDAELAALYRRADLLLVPSEHEGFCVPVVEAFSFDVPVVTRGVRRDPRDRWRRRAGAAVRRRARRHGRGDGPGATRRGRASRDASARPGTGPGAQRAGDAAVVGRRAGPGAAAVKILYCVQRYGLEIAGGAEAACRNVAERMVARGHQVEVLTTCALSYNDWADHFAPGTSELNGVVVHRVQVREPRDEARFVSLHRRCHRGFRRGTGRAAGLAAHARPGRPRAHHVAGGAQRRVRRHRLLHLPVCHERVRRAGGAPSRTDGAAPDGARRGRLLARRVPADARLGRRLRVPHRRGAGAHAHPPRQGAR